MHFSGKHQTVISFFGDNIQIDKGHFNGNDVYQINLIGRYPFKFIDIIIYGDGNMASNGDGACDKSRVRECPHCGKMPIKEGYDACLGKLPGVMAGCCGHGNHIGYIYFKNGKHILFKGMISLKEKKEVK